MAHQNNTDTLSARINGMLQNRAAHNILDAFPDLNVSAEDIETSGMFSHISGREEYLAWVADYKALIKDLEAHIRSLKVDSKSPDLYTHSSAQMYHHRYAYDVTALIRMRRLGKIWSAAEAAKRLSDAA